MKKTSQGNYASNNKTFQNKPVASDCLTGHWRIRSLVRPEIQFIRNIKPGKCSGKENEMYLEVEKVAGEHTFIEKRHFGNTYY